MVGEIFIALLHQRQWIPNLRQSTLKLIFKYQLQNYLTLADTIAKEFALCVVLHLITEHLGMILELSRVQY